MRAMVLVVVMLYANISYSIEWEESPEVAAVFTDAGIEGTFVLYDVEKESFIGYNRSRSEKRFIPASTFKIVNSLIGLSVGAVDSVDEIIPFVGETQANKAWEKDMSLRDAIAISNVPIYQELARRIGMDFMRRYLAELAYGNSDPGERVDIFWLQGPLEISAVEQCLFLSRLAAGTLPLPRKVQESVRDILKLDAGDGWVLYGKTGGAVIYTPSLGWWVGWVAKEEQIYTFALNIDMPNFEACLPLRMELGRNCLQALKLTNVR